MLRKTDPHEVADIPDEALLKAIRKSLGLGGVFDRRPVTISDMKKLHTLTLYDSSNPVRELTGIQYASDLTSIDIKQAAVTDLWGSATFPSWRTAPA